MARCTIFKAAQLPFFKLIFQVGTPVALVVAGCHLALGLVGNVDDTTGQITLVDTFDFIGMVKSKSKPKLTIEVKFLG